MVPTVLFEDNHLIAVWKAAGVSVQADTSGLPSLLDLVKADLKQRHHKPGKVFLGLVHRLDKPVQGVFLIAKTSKAASRLSDQFRTHTTGKTYHALVEGSPEQDEGTLVHHLGDDASSGPVAVSQNPSAGLKRAELSYRVRRRGKTFSFLEVALLTGRKHQIRAQLSALGHPIAGDRKYGGEDFAGEGIGLFSYSLEFDHPIGGRRMRVEAPQSGDQVWKKWL